MDYYSILGVPQTASADEIKQAYRKLAAKHHPDRGGDTTEFQKIEEAYRTLKDPAKRAQYNNLGQNSHRTVEDVFNTMFGFNHRNQPRKNKNITIRIQTTLKDVLNGQTVIGSIKLPSGREQALQLQIPKGVSSGDAIKFTGLGDDSISDLPRGDLIAVIEEVRHTSFLREQANLHTTVNISAFDAIVGTTISVPTVEGTTLEVAVPAGIQHGQMLSCTNYGLPLGPYESTRGNLYVKINITIPRLIDDEDKEILKQMKAKYS